MTVSKAAAAHPRLLPAQHALRPAPPDDVWEWRNYPVWRQTIQTMMADLVTEEVKAAFLEDPPEYVVSDDLSWLNDLLWSVHERDFDSKELVTKRLLERFRAIRVVHGTRTANVDSFYEKGLVRLDPPTMHARAKEIFLSGRFPELTEESVQNACDGVGTDWRAGLVFFEGNELELVRYCGHYMLYGSEYLTAIAAHFRGGVRDYRQVLKEHGEPTLFICDVPLELINPSTISEFAGNAMEWMFEALLDPEFEPDSHRGAGFPIRQDLPPDCIVGHYHPVVKRDPFF